MQNSILSGLYFCRAAAPGLERGVLQRAAINKGNLPGKRAELVDGIEILRGHDIALAAGKKNNPWHGGGHIATETAHRGPGNVLSTRLLRRILAGDDHARFQEHLLEDNSLAVKSVEVNVLSPMGHFLTSFD